MTRRLQVLRAIGAASPGPRDILTWGGLLLAGAGVWQWSPPAAALLVGTVCFAVGLLATLRWARP